MAKITAKEALEELNVPPEVEETVARERQIQQWLYAFNGFSSRELAQFSARLIRELESLPSDTKLKREDIISNFEAITKYIQAEEQMEKENKSTTEIDRRASLTKTQQLNVERQQNMEIGSGGQLVSNESRAIYGVKFAMAKIQDIVAQAKENIEMKVTEIKNNIEERKFTDPQEKMSFLSRIKNAAQKAKREVVAFGNKGMDAITKLFSKDRSHDVETRETRASQEPPINIEARLKAMATLNDLPTDEEKMASMDILDSDIDQLNKELNEPLSARAEIEAPSYLDQVYEEIAKVDVNIGKTVGEFKGTAEKLLQEKGLERDVKVDPLDAALKAMDDAKPAEKNEKSHDQNRDPGSVPPSPRSPG